MQVPTNTCVFCSTKDNLNTKMTISPEDGVKVEVSVCDEHAEEATVKSVKKAYEAKKLQIEEVMRQVQALGLNISSSPTKSGIVVATSQVKDVDPRMVSEAMQPPEPEIVEEPGTRIVPTSVLDKDARSFSGQATGSGVSMSIPSYNSYQISSSGTRDGSNLDQSVRAGVAKIAMVEGRDGTLLQVPVLRKDKTGTTRLTVKPAMNDHELQDRFKKMASESRYDRGPDFRNGYDADSERPCPICRGSGYTLNRGRQIQCPKCEGSGII